LGSPTKKHPCVNLTGTEENTTHDMEGDNPQEKVNLLKDFNIVHENTSLPPKNMTNSKPNGIDPFNHIQQENDETKRKSSQVVIPNTRNVTNINNNKQNNYPLEVQTQNDFNKALLKTVKYLQEKIEELTAIPAPNRTTNADNGPLNTLMATLINQASNSGMI